MYDNSTVNVPRETLETISWADAKKHGNGNLFKNHEKKGSIDSWRNKRNVGGTPSGRLAMSEITPFLKSGHTPIYCQCKEVVVDSSTFCCTKCGNYFDATENKKLESYRMTGV